MRRFVVISLFALGVGFAMATRPGLVNLSSASLRSNPSHASELETQAVYGTPVEILEDAGEWLLVRVPDGYVAYIPQSAVVEVSPQRMDEWRGSSRVIVTRPYPRPVVADTLLPVQASGNAVSDLTIGSILEGKAAGGSTYDAVGLPDGRTGYVLADDVEDFSTWASAHADADEIVETARAMTGIPYLWGGITEKGIDCSGLSQTCYLIGGRLLLPRNASQQAGVGQVLDLTHPETFQKGDLLFFGDDGRITHVAIYDGDTRYIHSSGRVFEASFDPDDAKYIPRTVVKAMRILSDESLVDSISIGRSPQYFQIPPLND